jgi:hypothetical protein
MTNHLVTQQKIRNNQTYPDLWVANPLVAGSSPAPPYVGDARNLPRPLGASAIEATSGLRDGVGGRR